VDYAEIAAAVAPVLSMLDHHVLNEVPGLENTTTEMLAPWVWAYIKPRLPQVFRIEIAESATTGCVYEEPERE
jgi:6-pyruvoyltetrahydropterin/6-carboxytetrahydropterin synthase